jgi:NADP-dependent 3-hydroxy acid dehydrogenase YdfG
MTADSTVDEINAITEAIGIEMDVRDEAAVQSMAMQVKQKWGRIDILVCNAGDESATQRQDRHG